MTKLHYILPLLILLLAGCSESEYLGVEGGNSTDMAIGFAGEMGSATRALSGAAAAAELSDSFVVYGFKTTSTTPQTVFDHYNVNFTDGSAGSTTSNTAGWEYVGQTANVLNSTLGTTEKQDIKYWDMAAGQYDFVAFSAGAATQVNTTPASGQVQFSPVDNASLTTKAYTITGATADLAKVYIADRVTATKEGTAPNMAYKNAVQFNFRSLAATVRIGLFETIPGYSVKDVKFYQQPISASGVETPYLYAGTQTIPSGKGIVNVSFPEENSSQPAYNKAVVKYDSEGEKTQTLTLGALTANAAKEDKETGGNIYLARTSSAASMTQDVLVVPAPASDLTLKVDFTLVSIDYNETINVKGAVATIPAQYTNWQSNYAYTYLFKISDMVTNAFGQVLYPITFDALETVDDDGIQQTITTIDQPSITTFAKGELGSDYYVGDNIYVSVANGTPKVLSASNSKLYTVSLTGSTLQSEITEKNIMDNRNAIEANTHDIHLTDVTSSMVTFTNTIDPEDSSTGDRITATGNVFAKFTAGNDTYVFEFTDSEPVYYQTAAEYNTDKGTTFTDQQFAALTNEQKIKVPAGKHYKVIRVGDAQRPLELPDIPEEEI